VRRADQGFVGKANRFSRTLFVERIGITVLKVSPATPLDKQGVACEYAVIGIGKVLVGMAGAGAAK
jgi:hypothetical protein